MINIPENIKPVQAIYPQTNAGAITGDYISCKNAQKVWVVANIQQGNAATMALTLEKATDVSGTGSTAITTAVPIWTNEDTATNDTLTRQTDAVSFTTSAAVKNKVVVFQVDPDTLGDYDCLVLKCGASDAANIIGAEYLIESRYAPANGISMITD